MRRIYISLAMMILALLFVLPSQTLGVLKIKGSTADKNEFLQRLAQFSGRILAFDGDGETVIDLGPDPFPDQCAAPSLGTLVQNAVQHDKETTINVGRGAGFGDVLIDNFRDKKVDLDDLNQFPEHPPGEQTNLGEWLAHILGEYYYAARTGKGYADAHPNGGLAAQNDYRTDKGKLNIDRSICPWPWTTVHIHRVDCTEETWDITNCDIDNINPLRFAGLPPLARGSPVTFEGIVLLVGSAPWCWSGSIISSIQVRYQVLQVIQGDLDSATVTIQHAVVSAPEPGVPPTVYQVGDTLRVKAELITGFSFGPFYLSMEEPIPTGDIPTLTEWGLIIFGVVLLGFITWVFLRRRKVVGVRI